jgi:hypothetical protein
MKKTIITLSMIFAFNSCGFLFYNYRANLETEYLINSQSNDLKVTKEIGNIIYSLSEKQKFYHNYVSSSFDSLYFYGPDYHHLSIKISSENTFTKVRLNYFGYNGNRNKPPHKAFINAITDSLTLKYNASQNIITNWSNERIR